MSGYVTVDIVCDDASHVGKLWLVERFAQMGPGDWAPSTELPLGLLAASISGIRRISARCWTRPPMLTCRCRSRRQCTCGCGSSCNAANACAGGERSRSPPARTNWAECSTRWQPTTSRPFTWPHSVLGWTAAQAGQRRALSRLSQQRASPPGRLSCPPHPLPSRITAPVSARSPVPCVPVNATLPISTPPNVI